MISKYCVTDALTRDYHSNIYYLTPVPGRSIFFFDFTLLSIDFIFTASRFFQSIFTINIAWQGEGSNTKFTNCH